MLLIEDTCYSHYAVLVIPIAQTSYKKFPKTTDLPPIPKCSTKIKTHVYDITTIAQLNSTLKIDFI